VKCKRWPDALHPSPLDSRAVPWQCSMPGADGSSPPARRGGKQGDPRSSPAAGPVPGTAELLTALPLERPSHDTSVRASPAELAGCPAAAWPDMAYERKEYSVCGLCPHPGLAALSRVEFFSSRSSLRFSLCELSLLLCGHGSGMKRAVFHISSFLVHRLRMRIVRGGSQ
jgi:hypothetical protein